MFVEKKAICPHCEAPGSTFTNKANTGPVIFTCQKCKKNFSTTDYITAPGRNTAELDWTEATETLDRIKCPHCNDCMPTSIIRSCPDEGEETYVVCSHCEKPFVCSWTAGPRYYHTLAPLPSEEPELMACDGHECPHCFRPLHMGLVCTSCEREFCPRCYLEVEGDECHNCSFEGIVDTLMHCKTIEDFAKHMQRLMLIERETNCDGVAMDNALNTLQAIAKRGKKK